MVKRVLILVVLTMVFLAPYIEESKAYMSDYGEDDVIVNIMGTGQYYFTNGARGMGRKNGSVDSNLFETIIREQQTFVSREVKRALGEAIASGDFEITIDVGLGYSGEENLWEDLNFLYSKQNHSTIILNAGTRTYEIFVPRGEKVIPVPGTQNLFTTQKVNQSALANVISAVSAYKSAIKEAIAVSSLDYAYNVYTMHPEEKQVPVTDVLRIEDGEVKIKPPSGVTMKYSLDTFYTPFFGVLDVERVINPNFSWVSKSMELVLNNISSSIRGSSASIAFDTSYRDLISSLTGGDGGPKWLAPIDRADVVNTNGLKKVEMTRSSEVGEPANLVNMAMRLGVISTFHKYDVGYTIQPDKQGYKLLEGVRLLVTHEEVYEEDEEGKFELAGSYANFGIDKSSLVLGSVEISEGTEIGVVIPLWYREGVIDTTTRGNKEVYYTGRIVKFGNDYARKSTLDGRNQELLSIESKMGSRQPVELRRFAFSTNTDYSTREDHRSIGNSPNSFKIEVVFYNDENTRGFMIVRNNRYIDDPDLIQWLESNEAQALAEAQADTLYELITSGVSIERQRMTYDQWLRVQEIRSEFDISAKSRLLTIIRVLSLVFGVLIIFYSLLLVVAYWVDVLNFIMDFSLLNFMTFGRLYPISITDDITPQMGDGATKYVTIWRVLFISFIGVFIGSLFIYVVPLMRVFLWLFEKIYVVIGGV